MFFFKKSTLGYTFVKVQKLRRIKRKKLKSMRAREREMDTFRIS